MLQVRGPAWTMLKGGTPVSGWLGLDRGRVTTKLEKPREGLFPGTRSCVSFVLTSGRDGWTAMAPNLGPRTFPPLSDTAAEWPRTELCLCHDFTSAMGGQKPDLFNLCT